MMKLMIVLCAVVFGSISADSYDPITLIQILNDDPAGHERIKQGLSASANKFKEDYVNYMSTLINTFTANINTEKRRAGNINIQSCALHVTDVFDFVNNKIENAHICINEKNDDMIKRIVKLRQERANQSGTRSINTRLLSANSHNAENESKLLESFLKSFEASLAPCMADMSTVYDETFSRAVQTLRFIQNCVNRLLAQSGQR